jgi:hypothetical protein
LDKQMKVQEFLIEGNDESTPIKLSSNQDDTPAKKFIRELRAGPHRINPIDNSMTIITSTKSGFSQAELKSVVDNPTRVHISFFQAYPQKAGIGSEGMKALQDMAAEDDISLELSVWTKGKVNPSVLKKFYASLGFKPKKGGLLVWNPPNKKPLDEARKKKDTGGDCYEAAGRNMMNYQPFSDKGMKLVHAFVSGQGSLTGRRYDHAWNELGDEVIDNSNGRNIRMPKQAYYALGNINPDDPDQYRVYDMPGFRRMVTKYKHWGPWELKNNPKPISENSDIETMQSKLEQLKSQALANYKLYHDGKLRLVHGIIPGPWKEIRELQAKIRAAKREAKKSTLSDISEGTPSNRLDIERMALANGYHRIGKGVDASIYAKNNTDFVIKILTGSHYNPSASAKTFMKFYNFCRKNADVPYLPKFGPLEKLNLGYADNVEKFYHTSMEKLQPIDRLNWKAMNFLIHEVDNNNTWSKVHSDIDSANFKYEYTPKNVKIERSEEARRSHVLKKFMEADIAQWKNIFYLLKLLKRRRGQSGWDPHRGNIMQRANGTPVIIDPWVD